MGKRTPLYPAHEKLGARLIDFGGWDMPVQYTGILEEHHAVRNAAGIFDISHMGEFFVSGPSALEFLNHALTNDARKLRPGQGQYTLMCNERGGTVDDLYLYCVGRDNYLLIVNASRIEADFAWLASLRERFTRGNAVLLEDKSDSHGAIAIQGPAVGAFIDAAFPAPDLLSGLVKNELRTANFQGELIYAARTGYTGEDGFEVIAPAPLMDRVWESCMAAGQPAGLKPCGLGARDTLRLEACYPLYGHELDEATSPIEAGVGYFVALDKGEFVGNAVLAEQKKALARKLVAFRMTGKAPPPRADYGVFAGNSRIGQVTSGTQSPTLGVGIGLAYVPTERSQPETALEIEVRGRRFPAVIVKKPFYKRAPAQ
jgi:aminomethyltransferase